jgi:hypothetical protein
MKKTALKKLQLHKNTVRELTFDNLQVAHGGRLDRSYGFTLCLNTTSGKVGCATYEGC